MGSGIAGYAIVTMLAQLPSNKDSVEVFSELLVGSQATRKKYSSLQ
jgi:hypothetical protein